MTGDPVATQRAPHILVVEDDAAVARGLRDGLERRGYTVTWCASGAEALRLARAPDVRLIVLDVRLPDVSGFDVCRQLRRMRLNQPILMLTVEREEADKVLGLEAGADDYVTKPFGLSELLSRVRALLRRAYGELSLAETNVLPVGDLVIDFARAQVLRDGHDLALTPTEFRLLSLLARHPNQALSRGQIGEALWGPTAELESERAVTVHVRRLREKVETDPSRPSLILTVPGVGYRLAR